MTLTDWGHVLDRFRLAPRWLAAGGSGGWNDLDSLTVGGAQTGLTPDERQTMVTFWALAASPLIIGDDLRTLDASGLALLTNPEVLGINQHGVVAAPLKAAAEQHVWVALQPDGSYTVGLFNLGETAAAVQASWRDVGFTGPATVRDVWAGAELGTFADLISVPLAPHASRLLRVTPTVPVRQILASSGTLGGWALPASGPVGPRGQRVQFIGLLGALTFPHVAVSKGGLYDVTINYVNGDTTPRGSLIIVNNTLSWNMFPAKGGWGDAVASQGLTTPATLSAGDNRIIFWNPIGWAPEVAAITVQPHDYVPPAYYQVMNVATKRFLDVALALTDPGTPIIQAANSGATSQQWQMISNGRGEYYFINRLTGQAMDIYATGQPGLPLVQQPPAAGANQQWLPVASGNGAFVLVNRATGLAIRASAEWNGAMVDELAPAGGESQQWIIVPVM